MSLFPLALTPVFGYLLAEDHIKLGGGEKDIVVLLPWLWWSLVFAVSSFIFWRRGHSLGATLWRSALVGLAGVAITGVVLALLGQLGVAGRFYLVSSAGWAAA